MSKPCQKLRILSIRVSTDKQRNGDQIHATFAATDNLTSVLRKSRLGLLVSID